MFIGLRRQVNEGVWKNLDEYSSPSPKLGVGEEFRKSTDFEIPTSPPLNLNENSLANWSPHSGQSHAHSHTHSHTHSNPSAQREKDSHGVGSLKGRGLEELGGRGSDKASSVEVRLVRNDAFNRLYVCLKMYLYCDTFFILELLLIWAMICC